MLTLGVLATVASLRVFGKSRVVFWRESAAGISVFSRYLATLLVDLIDITLRPFFFVLVYRSFIYPSITFTCVCPRPRLLAKPKRRSTCVSTTDGPGEWASGTTRTARVSSS